MSTRAIFAATMLVCAFYVLEAVALGQQSQDRVWRDAFGEPRATVVEGLSEKLFPGSRLQWGQHVSLLRPGLPAVRFDLPRFALRPSGNGWEGWAGIEIGTDKEEFLKKAVRFGFTAPQKFSTDIVVFRAMSDLRITDLKTFPLDSADPVTQLVELGIKSWPVGQWPILNATYHSYYVERTSVGSVTWSAMINANTGVLVGKAPLVISKKTKGGSEQIDYLSVKRIDANTIQISGDIAKRSVKYPCSIPCSINGQTLFDQW